MHVESTLSLAKVADDKNEYGDLAISHITQDRGKPEFRRHVWLVISYLIDFYLVFMPWQFIARDLHLLGDTLVERAKEMEADHA